RSSSCPTRRSSDLLRLHLEDAAADGEVEHAAIGPRDHDLARLEPGDQRRMARRDAELAHLAGGHDQGRFSLEDLGFGTDDVATDGGHDFLTASGNGTGDWGFGIGNGKSRPSSWSAEPGTRRSGC